MRLSEFLAIGAVLITPGCGNRGPAGGSNSGSDSARVQPNANQTAVPAFTIDQIAAIPDDKLIDTLNERAQKLEARNGIASMPKGLQIIFACEELEAEVNNGGYHQYFWNSSGENASIALEGLRAVGAIQRAQLTEKAISIHTSELHKADRYKDRGGMDAFVESSKDTKLDALDDPYYALTEDLRALEVKYVRHHPEQFAGPG